MRGRKPKPKPITADENIGSPPSDLDVIAKRKWRELIKSDAWGSIIARSDRDMLAEYCRLESRKRAAEKQVAEHGELVAAPNGFPMQNPWLAVVNKCRTDMMKIAIEFGGTPSSRARGRSTVAGKKAEAAVAATTAGAGTEWGDDLQAPSSFN